MEKTDNRRINPNDRLNSKTNEKTNIPQINDAPVPEIVGKAEASNSQKNST